MITGGSHGFDTGTASRLSRLGEQAATEVLRWLNDNFPQDPPREAQTADIDLATAPDRTGEPPTTFDTRRRPSSSTHLHQTIEFEQHLGFNQLVEHVVREHDHHDGQLVDVVVLDDHEPATGD